MNPQKEKIRKDAIKHRDGTTKNPDDPDKIATRFLSHFPNLDKKTVALYWPIKSEIDTYPLLEALLKQGTKICLPKTEKKGTPLTFLEWDGKETLIDAGFGTKAPDAKVKNHVIPDIIIIPLVAFDRYGTRLGYGQGHYDTTISALDSGGHIFKTVGYAYDHQICLFPLPKEEHDQKLDMILTPTQTY